MNNQFLAAKLLQGIQQEELKNGEHSADEQVGIKKEKIGKRPLPHCKGIRVFGSAVVAMVLKVIFFERDKGNNDRALKSTLCVQSCINVTMLIHRYPIAPYMSHSTRGEEVFHATYPHPINML